MGYESRWDGTDYIRTELPPDLVFLDAATLVIVEIAPEDEVRRNYCIFSKNARPKLPDDLDTCIIEPHAAYFKRQFRKTKLMQAKWVPTHTKSILVRSGKPQGGCRGCKIAKRRYGWRNRNWNHNHDRLVGCKNHIKQEWEELPHPDRGKVFATFSAIKLHGLAPGTTVVAQIDGVWTRVWVHEYAWWTAKLKREEADSRYDKKAAAQLAAQRARSNERYRAGHKKRRHLALPTAWDRVMGDDDL